jgi:hypothetical protein
MLFAVSWWAIVPAFFLLCTGICCLMPLFAVDEELLGIAHDEPTSAEVVVTSRHGSGVPCVRVSVA